MTLPTAYSEDKIPERINPEQLEVAETYLKFSGSISKTSEYLNIPKEQVSDIISQGSVKRYIDSMFQDAGYMNRFKLAETLEKVIEKKMEELEEAEIGSSKDIADLLDLAIKFYNTLAKLEAAKQAANPQTNIQTNIYGEGNYGKLVQALATGKLGK